MANVTIENIDFKLLKKQKAKLIEVLHKTENLKYAEILEGIIHLIDVIQDTNENEKDFRKGK